MIENIQALWPQIENKTGFIKMCADDVGKKPNTLRHHWFCDSGFWSIPEDHQPRVVELLQNTIASQNAKEIEVESEIVK